MSSSSPCIATPCHCPTYALVAFDLDSTLIDSESRTIPSLLKLLSSHYNLHLTPEEWLKSYHGMAGPKLLAKLNADHGTALEWDEFWPRRFAALEEDVTTNGFAPAPGMLQMLRRVVANGQQVCIVSNSNPARIKLSLEHTHGQRQHGIILPALFEGHTFAATDPAFPARQSKPAPDAYLAAAAYYGANPANCLAVEDSATGVQAAVAAGFTCWGYTGLSHQPGHAEVLKAAGASHVFNHWDEFLA